MLFNVIFHPYSFLTLMVIFFAWASFNWFKNDITNNFLVIFYLGLAGISWFITIGKTLIDNPGFSGLMLQVQKSPGPLLIILGWGILFLLALVGLFSQVDKEEVNF